MGPHHSQSLLNLLNGPVGYKLHGAMDVILEKLKVVRYSSIDFKHVKEAVPAVQAIDQIEAKGLSDRDERVESVQKHLVISLPSTNVTSACKEVN
jgi:hypothetical protein